MLLMDYPTPPGGSHFDTSAERHLARYGREFGNRTDKTGINLAKPGIIGTKVTQSIENKTLRRFRESSVVAGEGRLALPDAFRL